MKNIFVKNIFVKNDNKPLLVLTVMMVLRILLLTASKASQPDTLAVCARFNSIVNDKIEAARAVGGTHGVACSAGEECPFISAWEAAERIAPFVTKGSTVLDIGGHLGMFSQSLLAMTSTATHPIHIAIFEPLGLLHACEVLRLGRGRFEAATLAPMPRLDAPANASKLSFHHLAIGEHDQSVATILVAPPPSDEFGRLPSGWNTVLQRDPIAEAKAGENGDWKAAMGSETIVIRSLSALIADGLLHSSGVECKVTKQCASVNKVSAIKVDVEGFEGRVIRGAMQWLRTLSAEELPVWLVEVAWGTDVHPERVANLETYRELEKLGYCPLQLPRSYTADVLFIPRVMDPLCEL